MAKGGLTFTVKLPDGMIKECMKFMAKELLKGRLSFDLPIKLNGKNTTLEFISQFHEFLPNFIGNICKEKDLTKQVELYT